MLAILGYHLHFIERAVAASRGVASYLRRKVQIEDIYNGVFANLLPLRSEPIIPGIDSDIDSEFAESVHLIGDKEQEPQPVVRHPGVPWRGVFRFSFFECSSRRANCIFSCNFR